MRIFHCIPTLASGGAERQLACLVEEQTRQGHTVDVAYLDGGPNLARIDRSQARLHHLPAANNHDPRIVAQLVRLLRLHRPDVVQTWLTQMDVLGGLAAKLCGLPYILSENSAGQHYPRSVKNVLRSFIGGRADAIVANSAGGAEYWHDRVGAHTRVRQIANPMPLEEIDGCPPASDSDMGVAPGQRMILIVSRLSYEKNLPVLIQALAVAAARAEFVVRICGEGDAPRMQRQIDELGLSARVRLAGYISPVWAWMKRANLFVSVSHYEGRPNAVLEAAICGSPLILSDIPSHRELFDESSARFVDRHRPQEIADAIVETLEQEGFRQARVEQARQRGRGLTIVEVESQFHDLYRELAGTA